MANNCINASEFVPIEYRWTCPDCGEDNYTEDVIVGESVVCVNCELKFEITE